MISYESAIALRYLKSRRQEVFISIITIISILGVAVSVMVLDIVLGVMTGFEGELKSKLIDTSSHIIVRQFGGEMKNWEPVRDEIKRMPAVVSATPYSYSQCMLSISGSASGLLMQGITNVPEQVNKLQKSLVAGDISRLFQPADYKFIRPDGEEDTVKLPTIIVGKSLASRYGIRIDEPVTLLAPQFSASPQGMIPKLRRFLVVGIYSSGLVEYESGLGYISLDIAQNFFNLGEAISGIEVMIADLDKSRKIAEMIVNKLEAFPGAFEANDWSSRNKPLYDALNMEKKVYFIVLLLLILVASFSIISTLVMVVMEKSRDIAILKTLGAKDSSIRKIFFQQGFIIGLAGTILGTVLGMLGCYLLKEFGWKLDESVFALSTVPVYFSLSNFLTVAVASLIITSLAGIYPAQRASRLRVADALRFE